MKIYKNQIVEDCLDCPRGSKCRYYEHVYNTGIIMTHKDCKLKDCDENCEKCDLIDHKFCSMHPNNRDEPAKVVDVDKLKEHINDQMNGSIGILYGFDEYNEGYVKGRKDALESILEWLGAEAENEHGNQ